MDLFGFSLSLLSRYYIVGIIVGIIVVRRRRYVCIALFQVRRS
jgi:hypothetical protein